jgi:hypothetical protein
MQRLRLSARHRARITSQIVAIASLIVASYAGSASAATLRRISDGTVASDAGRYSALRLAVTRRVLVRDETDHTRAALTDVPPGCSAPEVGGRWLLMSCPPAPDPNGAPYPVPRIWDLRSRRPLAVADPSSIYSAGANGFWVAPTFHFTGIGKRWVAVAILDSHGVYAERLFDWHAGRTVDDPSETRHRVSDLDAVSGSAPLCAPFARQPIPSDPSDPEVAQLPTYFSPAIFEPPYLVARSRSALRLRRCETQSRRLITGCGGCVGLTLAGGTVAWSDGDRVHALVIRSWRKRSWELPRDRQLATPIITVSRRRIFVQPSFNKLWSGLLPGR